MYMYSLFIRVQRAQFKCRIKVALKSELQYLYQYKLYYTYK